MDGERELVHGFFVMFFHEGMQTDECMCGAQFTQSVFDNSTGLNEHLRQAWSKPPCEWEDLKHLTSRNLRDRLKSRADVWRAAALGLADSVAGNEYKSVYADIRILCDLIMAKYQALEQENDRLWEEHLNSFEHLLDEPDGPAKIVAALGAPYLGVIADRRAARLLRNPSGIDKSEWVEEFHVPGIQEVS